MTEKYLKLRSVEKILLFFRFFFVLFFWFVVFGGEKNIRFGNQDIFVALYHIKSTKAKKSKNNFSSFFSYFFFPFHVKKKKKHSFFDRLEFRLISVLLIFVFFFLKSVHIRFKEIKGENKSKIDNQNNRNELGKH